MRTLHSLGRGRVRGVAALFSLALAAGLLAWTVQRAGPAEIATALAGAAPGWVLVALVLGAVRLLVSALRLHAVTQPIVPSRFGIFPGLVLGSLFVGLIVPGPRIAPLLWRALVAGRRLGGGAARHLAPNIADQLVLGSSWAFIGVLSAPFLVQPGGGPSMALLLPAALLPALAAVLAYLLRDRVVAAASWLRRRRPGSGGRALRGAGRAVIGIGLLSSRPWVFATSIAGGFAFALLTGLIQHAGLLAVGLAPPMSLSLLAVIAGGVAGLIGGTPAGLGATEAAQVAVLVAHGIPAGSAGAAVLLATGTSYVIALAGGVAVARQLALVRSAPGHAAVTGRTAGAASERANPAER